VVEVRRRGRGVKFRIVQDVGHISDDTKLLVSESAGRRVSEMVALWSTNPAREWACILLGELRVVGGTPHLVVTEIVDLPPLASSSTFLVGALDDVRRIVEFYGERVVGTLHTHPSGDLYPSPEDMTFFIACDLIAGKPLKHVIVAPSGDSVVYSLYRCWNCPHSFLKAFPRVEVGEA